MNSAGLSQFQKRLFQRISRLLTGRTGWMLVILLWATVVTASSTYDLNTTWGNGAGTNNPQGQWSLRYGTDLLPQHYWLGSESAWLWDWSGATVPSFAFETLTKWNDCLPGDIVMQGDSSASAPHANILWIAPSNGTINISGRTWDAYGGRGGAWTLSVGGSQVAGGTIAGSSKRTSPGVSFAENILPGQGITNAQVVTGTQVIFSQDYGTAGVEMTISFEGAPVTGTNIVITSFHGDGKLTWINADSNLFSQVEWASSLTGSNVWHSNYSSLGDIQTSNGSTTVSVPMFYRVSVSSNRTQFAAPVARTGQTNSYLSGDDGQWLKGVASPVPRFSVQTDTNVVLDNLTGLMWSRNANPAGYLNLASAIAYCTNQTWGGYKDWRVPNVKELHSLIDFGKSGPVLSSGNLFINVQPDHYWSSTTTPWDGTVGYIVHFGYGRTIHDYKSNPWVLWPVRGGQ